MIIKLNTLRLGIITQGKLLNRQVYLRKSPSKSGERNLIRRRIINRKTYTSIKQLTNVSMRSRRRIMSRNAIRNRLQRRLLTQLLRNRRLWHDKIRTITSRAYNSINTNLLEKLLSNSILRHDSSSTVTRTLNNLKSINLIGNILLEVIRSDKTTQKIYNLRKRVDTQIRNSRKWVNSIIKILWQLRGIEHLILHLPGSPYLRNKK